MRCTLSKLEFKVSLLSDSHQMIIEYTPDKIDRPKHFGRRTTYCRFSKPKTTLVIYILTVVTHCMVRLILIPSIIQDNSRIKELPLEN